MTASSRQKLKPIPDYLIYEMDDGKPIYYRGYKDVLNGEKTFEGIIGNGLLHCLLLSLIRNSIHPKLNKKYSLLSSQLGISMDEKNWRLANMTIFNKKELLKCDFKDEYIKISPKIVIELDTKAHFENASDVDYYFQHKTDQLLNFGVEKVIWIYTRTEKFIIAEKDKRWETANWTEDLEVMDGIMMNIPQLIEQFYQDEEEYSSLT